MVRSNRFVLVLFALVLFVSACQPVAPEVAMAAELSDETESLEAVRAVSAQFPEVYAQGDAAAVAALYTEDGMIMAPNSEIVTTHPDIEAFWQGVMDLGVTELEIVPDEIEVYGDTAIERGNVQLFLGDGTSVDTVKYILVWKEQDGRWLLHRDMWNSNLPAPSPEEASAPANECALSTLQGVYMFHGEGMTPDGESIVPYAEAGIIYLDGEGNQEGIFSSSINGAAVDQQTHFTGTYEVAAELETGCAFTSYAPVGDEVLVFHYYSTHEGATWTYFGSGFSGVAVKQ